LSFLERPKPSRPEEVICMPKQRSSKGGLGLAEHQCGRGGLEES